MDILQFMLRKNISISMPNGAGDVSIPDGNRAINSGDGFVLATDSMNIESDLGMDGYFSKKGVAVCGDIFTATGALSEEETRISIFNENGKLVNSTTAQLTKLHHDKKGFSQWCICLDGLIIYYLPERLINFNNQGREQRRVDLNRAALMCVLNFLRIPFRNLSKEKAFFRIKKGIA